MSNSNDKPVKLKATLYWVFANKVNPVAGKYTIDLGNLSDKAVKALAEMGVEVSEKTEPRDDGSMDPRGKYITVKSQNAFWMFDEDGDRMPSDQQYGNGSKAVALVGTYEWTFKGKKGKSPQAERIVITHLEEFAGETMTTDDAL